MNRTNNNNQDALTTGELKQSTQGTFLEYPPQVIKETASSSHTKHKASPHEDWKAQLFNLIETNTKGMKNDNKQAPN